MNMEVNVLFEGMTSIRSVIEIGKRKIVRLLYDDTRKEKKPKELAWLKHRSEEFGFDIEFVPREHLDELCMGNTHGGVAAYCESLNIPPLSADNIKKNGLYFMLAGIEDPFNFGFAVRSVYAAGADGIILPQRNWMNVAGIVCRSSAGASERIPMYTLDNETDILMFHEKDYRIICADLRDSISVFDAELKKPIVCVVGGEKRGISRALLDTSDLNVHIPYGRDFSESLSAASAAAVIAFEVLKNNI